MLEYLFPQGCLTMLPSMLLCPTAVTCAAVVGRVQTLEAVVAASGAQQSSRTEQPQARPQFVVVEDPALGQSSSSLAILSQSLEVVRLTQERAGHMLASH